MRLDKHAAAPSGRLPALDMARGAALAAMFVYHFAWDLGFTGLIAVDVANLPAWRIFAKGIAASFLALVGVSLVLATRGGVKPRPFLRRLAMIAAAALAITLGTYLLTPDAFIFFGILHCIAVSSVLALPFLRLPLWLVLGAAIFCFAAPWVLAHPVFDAPALHWLGLMTYPPRSNDYVPIFPWFGMVLAGVAAARASLQVWPGLPLLRRHPKALPARLLAWAGRHSLAVYLLHQPVLLAALSLLALALPPAGSADEAAGFDRSCRASCVSDGSGEAACRASCACLAAGLQASGLRQDMLAARLDPAAEARVSAIARQCRGAPRG